MRAIRRSGIALLLAGLPLAAAATEDWSEREICRSAVKVYFFLGDLPEDALDDGELMGYRAASGNTYHCRVAGEVAEVAWLNGEGREMSSRSTTWAVEGGLLRITTDMLEEDFPRR